MNILSRMSNTSEPSVAESSKNLAQLVVQLRTLRVSFLFFLVCMVVLPLALALFCFLIALFPIVLVWALADKLWKVIRNVARRVQCIRLKTLALEKAKAVLEQRISVDAAVTWFSNRPFGTFAVYHVLRRLMRSVEDLEKAGRRDTAIIVACLLVAYSDKSATKEDKIKGRGVLVRCVYSGGTTDSLREQCGNYLLRDGLDGYLFAASQIERAKLLLKGDAVDQWQEAITVAQAALNRITVTEEPLQWVSAKSLIANAFWKIWQATKDPRDLDLTIRHGTECVEGIEKKNHPADWAVANLNLGIFCAARGSPVSQDDVERIVACMESALEVYQPGHPNYVTAHMRLMSALSKRSKGDERVNLDRGIRSINLALTDPKLTPKDKASLEKSLNTLLARRWGPAIAGLAGPDHTRALEQALSEAAELPVARLHQLVPRREKHGEKVQILRWSFWIASLASTGFCIWFWRMSTVLVPALIVISLSYLLILAAITPEALEKWTRMPLEYLQTFYRLVKWFFFSKDSDKAPLIDSIWTFTSDPPAGVTQLGRMKKKISKEDNPIGWAIVAGIHAWLALTFPRGDHDENIEAAIADFRDAGDIFTRKRFGIFQSLADFGLAKAYLSYQGGNRKDNLRQAIELLAAHVLPATLIGPARKRGIGFGSALQLLGDAYSEVASTGEPEYWERAISCYVESIRPSLRVKQRASPSLARQVSSIARMNSGRLMVARSFRGIARTLLSISRDKIPDQRRLAVACLCRAYATLKEPGMIQTLSRFIPASEGTPPPAVLHSQQSAEMRYEILVLLAETYLAAGMEDQAQGQLGEAILRGCAFDCLRRGLNEHGYRALLPLGDYLFREKRWDEAIGIYDIAIKYIESARISARLLERRANIVRQNTEPFDRVITALIQTHRVGKAFDYVERGKSLGTSDLVNLRQISTGVLPNDRIDEYAKLQLQGRSLGLELTESANRDASGGILSATTSIWNRSYAMGKWNELHRVTERLQELAEELSRSNELVRVDTRALGNEGTLRLARETDAAFVFFRVTDSGTYGFATSPNGRSFVSAKSLTRGALEEMLDELSPASNRGWRYRPLEKLLRTLGDVLLKPLYELFQKELSKPAAIKFNRIVFIANRALSVLPLHACSWDEGERPKCFADEFSVSYSPSLSIYRSCSEHDQRMKREARFVGIFNPSEDLPFTDWEYSQLKDLLHTWECEFLVGKTATIEQVLSAAERSGVLHFSCHGTYVAADPMRSFLRLAAQTDFTVRHILEQIRLRNTWLVVLSACKSGLVDVKDAADEHFSLPIAFLFAGAPTAWGTFWSVDDSASALLTARAYRNLLCGGFNKVEALRYAQLWLRDATNAEIIEMLSVGQDGIDGNTPLSPDLIGLKQELQTRPSSERRYQAPFFWAAFHSVGA